MISDDGLHLSTAAKVDEAFSALPRLKVAAFLAGCDEAEFKTVVAATGVLPSALSKAATYLEKIGYLRSRKGYVARRPRTWLAFTECGQKAFASHLEALAELTRSARHYPTSKDLGD